MRVVLGLLLLGLALFASAGPAIAEQPPGRSSFAVAAIGADLQAYGRWLAEVGAISEPVQTTLAAVGEQAPAVMTARNLARAMADLRATITRGLATVDSVDSRLTALPTPDFPRLNLPADLQPATLKRQLLEMNGHARAALQSYIPLIEAAMRRDDAAIGAASARSMETVRLLLESQLLMTRALQAAVPPESGGWEAINVNALYYRVVLRLQASWPGLERPRALPDLSADLLALADELERSSRDGATKFDTQENSLRLLLAEVERRGDTVAAAVLHRQLALFAPTREYLALATDLAALLRREAPALARGPVTPERLLALYQRIYPIRDRFSDIERRLAALMSGA